MRQRNSRERPREMALGVGQGLPAGRRGIEQRNRDTAAARSIRRALVDHFIHTHRARQDGGDSVGVSAIAQIVRQLMRRVAMADAETDKAPAAALLEGSRNACRRDPDSASRTPCHDGITGASRTMP